MVRCDEHRGRPREDISFNAPKPPEAVVSAGAKTDFTMTFWYHKYRRANFPAM